MCHDWVLLWPETTQQGALPFRDLGRLPTWISGLFMREPAPWDATNADDVARLLDGAKPNLMVTDPPYGVDYDPAWRNRVFRQDGSRVGARAVGAVTNDSNADWRAAYALFPGDVAYVRNGGLRSPEVAESLPAVGFVLRAQIIWSKKHFVIGRGATKPADRRRTVGKRARDDGKPREVQVNSSSGEAKARKYRRWRDGRLGTLGAASKVRRVDPKTGEVMR
jgi:hypothetical protein